VSTGKSACLLRGSGERRQTGDGLLHPAHSVAAQITKPQRAHLDSGRGNDSILRPVALALEPGFRFLVKVAIKTKIGAGGVPATPKRPGSPDRCPRLRRDKRPFLVVGEAAQADHEIATVETMRCRALRISSLSFLAIGLLCFPAIATASPVFGDWDGNGTTTVGLATGDSNSNNLRWQLINTNTTRTTDDIDVLYGNKNTDTPVFGDWDGNNTTTIGVVRPDPNSNNWIWLLRNSNTPGSPDLTIAYGNKNTDIPVFGDWDGNNTTTIGVVRPDGTQLRWLLRNSNSAGDPDLSFLYGNSAINRPVFGDWDGNNTTTVGVTGPDSGTLNIRWQLRNANSSGNPDIDLLYGNQTLHQPVFGDWDGNNTTTIGAFTPNSLGPNEWLLRNSNSGGAPDLDFFFGGAA
jgi:hypothetical protein